MKVGHDLKVGMRHVEKEKVKALQKASNKGFEDVKTSLQGQLRGTCNKYYI